ncbi:hypothetical protein BTIS_1416 [Bifidobacterium tissieri]|uniref:Uncharacterized protein n=1 Tax=Bifidobacterium tissieri TaxID=1630162 RepID=A0A261FDX4_9BIFI|nr:hypothetical protein [Bifidobacterium tissieri]OZG57322.1 hypothetical protein BTIS_1416 [Bifidobacterium tissieri]
MRMHKRSAPKEVWYQHLTDETGIRRGNVSHDQDSETAQRMKDDVFHRNAEAAPEYDRASGKINASGFAIDESPFGDPYNLWDAERGIIIRHVNATWLDVAGQTASGLDEFLDAVEKMNVAEIVIHDDRPRCGNPAYRAFSRRSLDAFRTMIERSGAVCRVV